MEYFIKKKIPWSYPILHINSNEIVCHLHVMMHKLDFPYYINFQSYVLNPNKLILISSQLTFHSHKIFTLPNFYFS